MAFFVRQPTGEVLFNFYQVSWIIAGVVVCLGIRVCPPGKCSPSVITLSYTIRASGSQSSSDQLKRHLQGRYGNGDGLTSVDNHVSCKFVVVQYSSDSSCDHGEDFEFMLCNLFCLRQDGFGPIACFVQILPKAPKTSDRRIHPPLVGLTKGVPHDTIWGENKLESCVSGSYVPKQCLVLSQIPAFAAEKQVT